VTVRRHTLGETWSRWIELDQDPAAATGPPKTKDSMDRTSHRLYRVADQPRSWTNQQYVSGAASQLMTSARPSSAFADR